MKPTEQTVLDALAGIRYPGFTRDIVSFGVVRDLKVEGGAVSFAIVLAPGNPAVAGTIEDEARTVVSGLDGVTSVTIRVGAPGAGPIAPGAPLPMAEPAPGPRAAGPTGPVSAPLLPGVRHAIAVASGKGGVGKSTVAVNLAVALAQRGSRVGLLDADVYGPSIPLMMGVNERPTVDAAVRAVRPFERFGVRFMSLGFLVDRDTPMIWRGPMVMKAVETLLGEVAWGDLDVLVVDLPPGTGDAQLTLSQKVQLSGAVIVTTPQDVALADATKAIGMFRKVGVPVLGVVENMSSFACPHCGERTDIFGHGGGRSEAERLSVPFLGEIDLDPEIRGGGDSGRPIVDAAPDSPRTRAFLAVADRVLDALAAEERDSRTAGDAAGPLAWLRRWTDR